MRELSQAANDPSFLLKALSEGSGELRRAFYGLSRPMLLSQGTGLDEGWRLLAIPWHLREIERGVLGQIDTILSRRDSELTNVDFDDVPELESFRDEDADDLLDHFHSLRRHTSYELWELSSRQWERSGIHPYRGRISILEIARDVYEHDLEHLWQVHRMIEAVMSQAR